MCSHANKILLPCHHECCIDCGRMLGTYTEVVKMLSFQDWTNDSLIIPYTRSKRFIQLLDSVCLGVETNNDRKMLSFISKQKPTTQSDILKVLKTAPYIDKRYQSMHLFCKCFDPKYIPFSDKQYGSFFNAKKAMVQCFNFIETKHLASDRTITFFNYRFLVSVILRAFDLFEFTRYLKPMQCRKRVLVNINVLNKLQIKFRNKDFVIQENYQMIRR